jgi:hypothetical protein
VEGWRGGGVEGWRGGGVEGWRGGGVEGWRARRVEEGRGGMEEGWKGGGGGTEILHTIIITHDEAGGHGRRKMKLVVEKLPGGTQIRVEGGHTELLVCLAEHIPELKTNKFRRLSEIPVFLEIPESGKL